MSITRMVFYTLFIGGWLAGLPMNALAGDAFSLEEIQAIDTVEARSWHSFERNGDTYLVVANRTGNSVIYKWDGIHFKEFQQITSR